MEDKTLINFLRKALVKPHSLGEIRKIAPDEYKKDIATYLRDLVSAGEIVKIRGGRFGLPDEMNLVIGRVQGHPDGFGFILPEEKGEVDVYIGPKNFRKAMHGDKVVCRVEKVARDGKREGTVIRVLERATKTVAGVYESRGRTGVVVPSQSRMIQAFTVADGDSLRAKSGQVVVLEIEEYPSGYIPPSGRVLEILGFPGDLAVEMKIILREYDLPDSFPSKIEKAADKIDEPSEENYEERLDLRDGWTITIDGETAKDFDDAVSINEMPDGFELGVHIADVSNYVVTGTALDAEAYKRGNSTYFPGSVIPMLPFHLSNNVCSLRPNVERLTLSCIMRFDNGGEMLSYRFAPSVIQSRHRMTYTKVAEIIANPEDEQNSELRKNILSMEKLRAILHKKRSDDGSIEFDLPEPLIVIGEDGEPEKIIRAERNKAHMLIEEFMLAANRATAQFLEEKPSIFRVHPEPDMDKLEAFFDAAKKLGHMSNAKAPLHDRFNEILKKAEGHADEKLLNYILLRSMKQASYSTSNVGHFGLAFEHYTHFTSPIRRYPDLVIHRLIKAKLLKEKEWQTAEELEAMAVQCSTTERNSEAAERDIENMLKVRYAKDHEGDTFEGVITGVTSFGIFVELTDILVEGLLRLTDLHDDYYEFLEKDYSLVGKRTGKTYKFGQEIKVRIKYVDMIKKQVELEPEDAPSTKRRYPVKSKKFGKSKKDKRGKTDNRKPFKGKGGRGKGKSSGGKGSSKGKNK